MLSRERLQERFIEMIKIYSPSKGEKEMADWIENWLRERNIPFQSDHAGEAYGGNGRNIVAFVKGNTNEVLADIDSLVFERDIRRIKNISLENGLKGIAHYIIIRFNNT